MGMKESKAHRLSKAELVSLTLLSLGGLIITLAAPSVFLGMRLLLAHLFPFLLFYSTAPIGGLLLQSVIIGNYLAVW